MWPMSRREPAIKRCVVFIDAQNLFHAAKDAFGYNWPNYDPQALAQSVCRQHGWVLTRVFFYTGMPERSVDPQRHGFWANKLAVLGKKGVKVYSRHLKYTHESMSPPGGQPVTRLLGREKGIDLRLALDAVKLARERQYEVALIFSQDQDFSELVTEIRAIAEQQDRWIEVASAFPWSPASQNARGIRGTVSIRIDKAAYDACIDPNDYRPKEK